MKRTHSIISWKLIVLILFPIAAVCQTPYVEKIQNNGSFYSWFILVAILMGVYLSIYDKRSKANQLLIDRDTSPGNDGLNEHSTFYGVQYAGFWVRLLAFLIDAIFLILVNSLFFFFFPEYVSINPQSTKVFSFETFSVVLFSSPTFYITSWYYYAIMESWPRMQGTFGKIIMKIKVTNLHGGPITFGKASKRFWAKLVSSILLIGFIMVAFTKKKQGWHDQVSDCLVVRRNNADFPKL